MSVESNKNVVLNFLANISAGKTDAALALLDDNVDYWVTGKPDMYSKAGPKTKAQFGDALQGIAVKMPKGLRIVPKAFTAEGDRVAVEAESYGETVTGKTYNNFYHFLFEVRDGKIHVVHEYLDTMHAMDVLGEQ